MTVSADTYRFVADLALGKLPRDGIVIATTRAVPSDGAVEITTSFRQNGRAYTFSDPFPTSMLSEWAGYSFELVGLLPDDASAPVRAPFWRLYDQATGATHFTVNLYRQRVRHGESNLYAEVLHVPVAPPRPGVYGWEGRHNDGDVQHARRALVLLGAIEAVEAKRAGRFSLEDDPDAGIGWLLIVERAEKLRQERPDLEWKWIADKVGIHPATLREYRRRRRLLNRT